MNIMASSTLPVRSNKQPVPVSKSFSNSSIERLNNSREHLPSLVKGEERLPEKEERSIAKDGVLSGATQDCGKIFAIFILYALQSLPLSLTGAVYVILRDESFTNSKTFSFVGWPFYLQILWAPLVDTIFLERFGRRKSWLIPLQYLMSFVLIWQSYEIESWLDAGFKPHMVYLCLSFSLLNILLATQKLVTDSWALAMLKPYNLGHFATYSSVGQMFGFLIAYAAFISCEAQNSPNIISKTAACSKILWYSGLGVIFITSLLIFLIKEGNLHKDNTEQRISERQKVSVGESYKLLLALLRLRNVRILAAVLLTMHVTFACYEELASSKLTSSGISKDILSTFSIPTLVLKILAAVSISKYTNGPEPLDLVIKAYPFQIEFISIAAITAYVTPSIAVTGQVPYYYYFSIFFNLCLYRIFLEFMNVTSLSFFAKVSDPDAGVTYMALFKTLKILGTTWPSIAVPWFVQAISWETNTNLSESDSQSFDVFDSFYLVSILSAVYGFVWCYTAKKWIIFLQNSPKSHWKVIDTET